MRQSRGKETIPMKKIKPGASSTEESTSTADGASGSVHDTPESKVGWQSPAQEASPMALPPITFFFFFLNLFYS